LGRVDCGGLTGPDCRVTGIMVASAGGSDSGAEMGAARLREGERAAQLRAGSCRKGRQSGAPIAVVAVSMAAAKSGLSAPRQADGQFFCSRLAPRQRLLFLLRPVSWSG